MIGVDNVVVDSRRYLCQPIIEPTTLRCRSFEISLHLKFMFFAALSESVFSEAFLERASQAKHRLYCGFYCIRGRFLRFSAVPSKCLDLMALRRALFEIFVQSTHHFCCMKVLPIDRASNKLSIGCHIVNIDSFDK